MIYIADTYAWIEYFSGNERYKKYMDGNQLKTPILVLAELSRTFKRKKIRKKEFIELLNFVLTKSIIIPFKMKDSIRSGVLAENEKIPLADAIIYLYASSEEKLLTGDEHFKNKKNVEFVK